MGVTASKEDKSAYAQIGGALDNISDSYTYVSKFLTVADGGSDPLTSTGQLAKHLKTIGKAQKIYSYARKIQDVLDEKKRQGGLLKLGIKISMDIAAKVLGTSLTTHPYYAYHKAMIDALADALNADNNAREAIDAYRRAVSAANSTAVAAEFKRIESDKVDVVSAHFQFKDTIGLVMDITQGRGGDAYLNAQSAKLGRARILGALDDLEAWRANWAGLCFDVMQLQIMTGNELNVATEAMARVKDMMKTLMAGSNTNRVAGYGAVNTIEWEKYDQIVNQKKPTQSLMDPVKFAQGNCDKAADWAAAFAEMCDFVRSDKVTFSSLFNLQLDKLNKVLYG
jgi:hypothetical protein